MIVTPVSLASLLVISNIFSLRIINTKEINDLLIYYPLLTHYILTNYRSLIYSVGKQIDYRVHNIHGLQHVISYLGT